MGSFLKDVESIHELACKLGATYYIDPETKKVVLTAHYLKKYGNCCKNSCRHCPYKEDQSQQEIKE